MSDLFNAQKLSSAKAPSYTADDIEVLEGLEPVRHRPGMYIGGTDSRAQHHLVVELLDNSMDEAVAGYANRIEIELHADGCVTVSDNGRGIPVDPHPKFPDQSALEVILTTLHSGGKFSTNAYKTSGGLHGVGVSVVNALSETFMVEVVRDRILWRQEYKQGVPVSSLRKIGPVHNRRGTTLTFRPDPKIFPGDCFFDPKILYSLARSKAYLFRGVEIRWTCAQELIEGLNGIPAQDRFHFPNGLKDFIETLTQGREDVISDIFEGQIDFSNTVGRIEWAIQWVDHEAQTLNTYCNTVPTPLGGSHENGFRQALTKSLKDYGERINYKKINQITPDDVMAGSIGMLSLFMQEPQFQGQTKEKLASPQVGRWIEPLVRDHLDHWLSSHREQAILLLDTIMHRVENRLRRKRERETSRKNVMQRLRLPGKLADCINTSATDTEIFLVEGESAGGSAKQARDRKNQAVLPLRGKILNVASASVDKQLNNQEIKDLTTALGCGVGKNCDPSKLRYGRIIIMTDADVDGAHIAALLITFFYREMFPLIEGGHIYLAQPPLYRLSSSSLSIYARDDADKEHLLATKFKGKKNVDISRFKGLGEMPWVQLRDTTMSSKNRTLLQLSLLPQENQKFAHSDLNTFITDLMGRKADRRYAFIQENVKFVENLDV